MTLTKEEIDRLKAHVARLRSQRPASSSLSAKENATRAATRAALPEGAKSVDQLLAEINALDDPGDQSVWWRENYAQIKRAQARARYAEATKGRGATP